ncbi:MAG TPA: pyridoxal-phosphate dependent enzyme [Thermoanaerobaculia bacterium]|nr:pyridoxal-phosphate dependent enzyme [Thermoanaerobaculia bacterium]
MITVNGIHDAARLLREHAPPTPLVRALLLSRDLGCELWIKNETVSPIASFKWRGALTHLLREKNPRGVVTSSTGNHGQGVAWAAAALGIPAHVFLPTNPNPVKRAKIELLGATIHEHGHDLDAAKEVAIEFASRESLPFVDDGESVSVIEGAGTIGLEIDVEPDVVYVPMGSGSLASGVAIAIKSRFPNVRVIAVQAKGSSAMVESFHARAPIERPASTVADGLICRKPAMLALNALIEHVDDAVALSDEELLAAVREMILGAHLLVEPSGAAGLAAAIHDRGANAGRRVVVIATGSNASASQLLDCGDRSRRFATPSSEGVEER